MNAITPVSAEREGATVVITHRVRTDRQEEYESWRNGIAPLCRAAEGHLDRHIVRPIRGLSEAYTVIIRFDTTAHLRAWMGSSTRSRLIEKVQPLLEHGDQFVVSNGLDFWFQPAASVARVPVRWKQYVVTWSAIYPLVLFVPMLLMPVLQYFGISANRYVAALLITGVVVYLMVYVVMPRYTNLLRKWLFS